MRDGGQVRLRSWNIALGDVLWQDSVPHSPHGPIRTRMDAKQASNEQRKVVELTIPVLRSQSYVGVWI